MICGNVYKKMKKENGIEIILFQIFVKSICYCICVHVEYMELSIYVVQSHDKSKRN